MKRKRKLNGFYLSTMGIFLLFILAFMALPVISLVSSALTSQATQTFSFENFENIFTSAYYAQSFGNSLKLSLQCSIYGIIIALFCSYAITRFVSERTQSNLLVVVNMTSNFAGLPLGFALTLMLGTTGVFVILLQRMGIDITADFSIYSVQGLVIAYTYFQVPLGIMLLYPIYRGIRGRLEGSRLHFGRFQCAVLAAHRHSGHSAQHPVHLHGALCQRHGRLRYCLLSGIVQLQYRTHPHQRPYERRRAHQAGTGQRPSRNAGAGADCSHAAQ